MVGGQIEGALDETVDQMIISYAGGRDLTASDRLLDELQRTVSSHGDVQWETATTGKPWSVVMETSNGRARPRARRGQQVGGCKKQTGNHGVRWVTMVSDG